MENPEQVGDQSRQALANQLTSEITEVKEGDEGMW